MPFFDSVVPKKFTSGIYSITHKSNGKIYIGSAVALQVRFFTHRKTLVDQRHHNKLLQRDFNEEPTCLNFSVIEEIQDKKKLIQREQFWINFYQSYFKFGGYNLTPRSGTCLGIKKPYFPRSEEAKKRQLERMMGFQLSAESRLKISKSLKGRKATGNQLKGLIAGRFSRRGIKVPQETINKMLATRLRNRLFPKVVK